eukprot:720857-Prorocentrum_lima.AAC.1
MTSSLVGSEMCIRDRNLKEPSSPLGNTPEFRTTKEISAATGDAMICSACLLYTSDAADDM